MNIPDIKQSLKLGAFVLGALLIFVISVFVIGKESNIFSKTFVIHAVFKNVEGLQKGDNVWLSGVKIGTVKSVEIIKEGKVIVNLSLRHKQNEFIRKNANASIGSDGFIGNKIVVIRPGDDPQVIQDEDTVNSLSPADTQELINIAKEVGENTKSITTDLKDLITKINKGQGVVGELLHDGPMAQDLRAAASKLRTTGENTAKTSSELSALVYNMQHGQGLLPTLISDTAFVSTFQQAVVNVKIVSQQASAVASNLNTLSRKINNSDNAVGVLLTDTAFAHKLKSTIGNTERASQKLDQNMEALKHNFLLRGYFRRQDKKDKEALK